MSILLKLYLQVPRRPIRGASVRRYPLSDKRAPHRVGLVSERHSSGPAPPPEVARAASRFHAHPMGNTRSTFKIFRCNI